MIRLACLLAVIIAVAITVASAPASPLLESSELSVETSAATADFPDEPSAVIATADFNHDGIADLVVATSPGGKDSGRHFLTVMLGKRNGTFARVASRNVIGSGARALVVGDFNSDGNPDVIVGDGDGRVLEFLGDGKGDLTGARNIAAVGAVVSLATGRFTHDGHLDLVVSDFSSNKGAVLLGAGDGSFRLTWSFDLPKRGAQFHIATADFNKDGITDLVISTEDSGDYEVMIGNGNGTFTYAPEISHLRDPYSYCPSS